MGDNLLQRCRWPQRTYKFIYILPA